MTDLEILESRVQTLVERVDLWQNAVRDMAKADNHILERFAKIEDRLTLIEKNWE